MKPFKYQDTLTKQFLIKEYRTNKKSTVQIAFDINVNKVTIGQYLKRYHIKIRTKGETLKGRKLSKKTKLKISKGNSKEKNGNWKDGITLKKGNCIDCDKEINLYQNKHHRCRNCSQKGKNAPMYGKRGKLAPMYGKIAKHGKGQYYKKSYMRSSWEVGFAKYCIINHIKYKYEPKAFEIIYKYEGDKKEGTYRPDFYLPETNEYIEIKGYWRDDAKIKFDAFKKQYPNINIKILMNKKEWEI